MTQTRLDLVKQRIALAVAQQRQTAPAVKLLAVSKTFPASAVLELAKSGQRMFGENYVQEGSEKIIQCRLTRPDLALEWHFIGPLQSNKTKIVAEHFDWVQSIDRLKIAQRLNEQRPNHLPPLKVCIQVNVSGEASKSGCTPSELMDLAQRVTEMPRLQLRGLMAIPEPGNTLLAQLNHMAELFEALRKAQQESDLIDTLSMGMSGDLEQAIAAGATMVRVGSALFGERTVQAK